MKNFRKKKAAQRKNERMKEIQAEQREKGRIEERRNGKCKRKKQTNVKENGEKEKK